MMEGVEMMGMGEEGGRGMPLPRASVVVVKVVVVVGVGRVMGACRKGSCSHHPPPTGSKLAATCCQCRFNL